MAIRTTIQMRRGRMDDFDPSKLLPGEWAVSIDADTKKQVVWMCFAAGVVKRMGTYEDFKWQFEELAEEIKEQYIKEFNAIQEEMERLESQAASSAATATQKATAASTSATNAATSATTATQKASEASTSAANAATSATTATQKASEASTSAANAASNAATATQKATAASTSAANAATSATTATQKASEASTSAANAASNAATATQKATAASTSAANAATSATTATQKATAASASATNAANSALLAKSYSDGDTGIREGESTDNSKFYSEQSKRSSDTSKEYLGKVEQAGNEAVKKLKDALDVDAPNFQMDLSTGHLMYEGGRFMFHVNNSGHLEWRLTV